MEIMHMDWITGHANPVFIGLAINGSRVHSGASEPRREDPVMVFSSNGVGRGIKRSSPKLGRPYHQRIVDQASLLQVS